MLSILTALTASVFLSVSSPGVNAGGEVQAVQPCCHCACCKGGVCKCGMHRVQPAAPVKASKAAVARKGINTGCHCRDNLPVSHPQSNDIIAPGASSDGEFQFLHSSSATVFLAPVQADLMPGNSVIFNTGPPGLFRSIPLRI